MTNNPRARHLYVHLPFCVHRCGYCDFVTVVGRIDQHEAYADALLAELASESGSLADAVDTVFVGGGTPTFTEPDTLRRILAALPPAIEVTVEANPETVTPELAAILREGGVNRISLGAQTFAPRLLGVLERVAGPDDIRRAMHTLRDASFDNISLDLIYGIPGQEPPDLDNDLAEALALAPEHLSLYELEAKPGTRFTRAWGAELVRQSEAMEGYFERVVETLRGAGYRWYETANFCVSGDRAGGRDLRAQHNLGYWQGRDYLGVGIGAVSTLGEQRRRNGASIGRYLGALGKDGDGRAPPRELEQLEPLTKAQERLMLGLRLDEPLPLTGVEHAIDRLGLERMVAGGLAVVHGESDVNDRRSLSLTDRGRFLGGGVTAELLA
ncbi:radical SAM family heme chaperone HemW [Gaiella sp.]|uniref:radical SAM family heme chaperone HemW n=1 Tax=Gaiella sp. TaxID=2663207 RepID=UPI0039837F93